MHFSFLYNLESRRRKLTDLPQAWSQIFTIDYNKGVWLAIDNIHQALKLLGSTAYGYCYELLINYAKKNILMKQTNKKKKLLVSDTDTQLREWKNFFPLPN